MFWCAEKLKYYDETEEIDHNNKTAPTKLPKEHWVKKFEDAVAEDPYREQALIAMEILCEGIKIDDSKTLQETIARMNYVREVLVTSPSATVVVSSSGELFTRFITRAYLEIDCAESIGAVRGILTRRGDDLIETLRDVHNHVAKHSIPIMDKLASDYSVRLPQPANVLTHSWSQSVCTTIIEATRRGFPMNVHVMECRPRSRGKKMCAELRKAGVPASVYSDTALSFLMEKTDFVLIAAEALTISGGVIGELGFSNIANVAKVKAKKVYVVAEMYKFTNMRYCKNDTVANQDKFAIPIDESDLNGYLNPDGSAKKEMFYDFTRENLIEYIISNFGSMSPARVRENTDQITI